jgi:hypothetical protein
MTRHLGEFVAQDFADLVAGGREIDRLAVEPLQQGSTVEAGNGLLSERGGYIREALSYLSWPALQRGPYFFMQWLLPG